MHGIVVLFIFYEDIHNMSRNSLYNEVSPYVRNICIVDYMMKVFLGMNEVVYACHVYIRSECSRFRSHDRFTKYV